MAPPILGNTLVSLSPRTMALAAQPTCPAMPSEAAKPEATKRVLGFRLGTSCGLGDLRVEGLGFSAQVRGFRASRAVQGSGPGQASRTPSTTTTSLPNIQKPGTTQS